MLYAFDTVPDAPVLKMFFESIRYGLPFIGITYNVCFILIAMTCNINKIIEVTDVKGCVRVNV